MPPPEWTTFALLAIIVTVAGGAIWLLGFKYGVRTFRTRHAQMKQAIEDYRKNAPLKPDNFNDGYNAGVTNTLEAMQAFVDRMADE